MSKSITQDMTYRQSLMKYAEKYGVSWASRKYNKIRSYIHFWRARWNGSVEPLACQSRRPHSPPRQHTEAELKLNPRFIACDEPVSALDVSIQAQIINLLQDLQKEFGLTYMFVTHDMSVVRHISHTISVMYLGQLVETCPSKELFKLPLHPYTKALISAIPSVDIDRPKKRIALKGELMSPINPKPGCRFAPRCPYAQQSCLEPQELTEVIPNHFVSCCRARDLNPELSAAKADA